MKSPQPSTRTGTQTSTCLTAAHAASRLPGPGGERFVTLFRHGSLEVEFYAPRGHDPQTPHRRDELYVVVSGRGEFLHDGRRTAFGPGDCLFVAAGVEHRFERFSDDFGAWVFFYGPEGGEEPVTSAAARAPERRGRPPAGG